MQPIPSCPWALPEIEDCDPEALALGASEPQHKAKRLRAPTPQAPHTGRGRHHRKVLHEEHDAQSINHPGSLLPHGPNDPHHEHESNWYICHLSCHQDSNNPSTPLRQFFCIFTVIVTPTHTVDLFNHFHCKIYSPNYI